MIDFENQTDKHETVKLFLRFYHCTSPMELICMVVDRLSESNYLSEIWEALKVKEVENIIEGDLYDYLLEFGGEPFNPFWVNLIYVNQELITKTLGGEDDE